MQKKKQRKRKLFSAVFSSLWSPRVKKKSNGNKEREREREKEEKWENESSEKVLQFLNSNNNEKEAFWSLPFQ